MIEQQRQRVEHEITALVDKVDRLYLRKMQVHKLNTIKSKIFI